MGEIVILEMLLQIKNKDIMFMFEPHNKLHIVYPDLL